MQAKLQKNGELERVHSQLRMYQDALRQQNEQLRESQELLEQSRDQYFRLYNAAPVPFLTLDRNGIIEQINQTGLQMLGRSDRQVIGRPLLTLIEREDCATFLDHMLHCRRAAKPTTVELRLKTGAACGSNGHEPKWVQLCTTASTRPRVGGICYPTAIIDITQIKRAERERQAAISQQQAARESCRAKDRFLAILSHELRTPLTPILAAVSSPGNLADAEHIRSLIEMIRNNVEMEARLIDDLLDVTRMTQQKMSLKMEDIDLHALLQNAVALLAHEIEGKSLKLTVDLAAERHHVSGDSVRLRQVAWNLLRNAIKFTPAGGQIAFRSRDGEARRITVQVSDTGMGIEPGLIPRLFNPFEQIDVRRGANSGLGLGLAICKGLIDAHQGQIRGFSQGPGTGARFEFELPTVEAPREVAVSKPAAPVTAPPQQRRHKLRILLVEDHADTARILARLIKTEGHDVQIAGSVSEAMQVSQESFDLIISDIGLPDGNGLDLMRSIRRKRSIRGIALSGFGTDDVIRESMEAGFALHMTKPIDFNRLCEAIDQLAGTNA